MKSKITFGHKSLSPDLIFPRSQLSPPVFRDRILTDLGFLFLLGATECIKVPPKPPSNTLRETSTCIVKNVVNASIKLDTTPHNKNNNNNENNNNDNDDNNNSNNSNDNDKHSHDAAGSEVEKGRGRESREGSRNGGGGPGGDGGLDLGGDGVIIDDGGGPSLLKKARSDTSLNRAQRNSLIHRDNRTLTVVDVNQTSPHLSPFRSDRENEGFPQGTTEGIPYRNTWTLGFPLTPGNSHSSLRTAMENQLIVDVPGYESSSNTTSPVTVIRRTWSTSSLSKVTSCNISVYVYVWVFCPRLRELSRL